MRTLSLAVLGFLATPVFAQSDIWLIDIKDKQSVDLTTAKNITDRPGYDNQPYFAKDGKGLYYTKMIGSGKQQQADIFYYNFATARHSNLTRTVETSEYSPLETPLQQNQLSIIKVERDGVQRLWTVNTQTGQQEMLNRAIKPVGYHAWGNNKDLTTFVLGEPMTLQYITEFNAKKAIKVDKNIGRSIRYNPTKDWFSYSKGDEEQQVIYQFNAETKQTSELIPLPKRSQYYTWFDDSTIITAQQSKLLIWNIDNQPSWSEFADVTELCPLGITRLAVNANQTKIALVCNEPSGN